MRRSYFVSIQMVRSLTVLMLLAALSACSTTGPEALQVAAPAPLPSEKYAAIVVDGSSGRTLYQVNANAYRYPASLTKMMTLYMLYEAIDAGRLSMASEIPVSAHAASQPPSKLGLKGGSTIPVRSAVDALSVKSANDVAAAVAEHLGGSEERFAAMMTAKARSLGMANTVFRNASGLPDDGQRTTARDMALLGIALKRRFPHHFNHFSQRSFAFRGRTIKGHNHMLLVEGVDGIKTGYIRASGFNIVTSVSRRGKRLVVVVMGGKTARERDQHVSELIDRFLPSSGAPVMAVAAPAPIAPAAPADDVDGLPGVPMPDAPVGASSTSLVPDATIPQVLPAASQQPASGEMGDGVYAAE